MTFFVALSICAVNLFVLISGYFLSGSNKRDFIKPIELLTQLVIFGLGFFLVSKVTGGALSAQASELPALDHFLSFFTPEYWFVFVYAALYLISPFINIVWNHLDEKGRRLFLYLSIGLFSIYPIMIEIMKYWSGRTFAGTSTIGIEGSQAGYTIVNFVLMYLLGCAIRDSKREYKTSKLLGFLCLDIALITGWTYFDMLISGKGIFETKALNYENPLVIMEAVLIFLIFKNIKMKENPVINRLAKAAFSVYLTHIQLIKFFRIEIFANGNPMLLIFHMLMTAALIYLISFIIFSVYDFITRPLFALIRKKWKDRTFSL